MGVVLEGRSRNFRGSVNSTNRNADSTEYSFFILEKINRNAQERALGDGGAFRARSSPSLSYRARINPSLWNRHGRTRIIRGLRPLTPQGGRSLATLAARSLPVIWIAARSICPTRVEQGSNPYGPHRSIKKAHTRWAFFIDGWGTRIRTWVGGVRVRSPTARRSPKRLASRYPRSGTAKKTQRLEY